LEAGWLFDRDVSRLRAAQDLIDKLGSAAEVLWDVGSVGDQASRVDVIPLSVDCGQSRCERQRVDASPVGADERFGANIKSFGAVLELLEYGRDILSSPNFKC